MYIGGKTFNREDKFRFLFICALIYLLHIVSAIICKRFYYADGAFFLARLINNQHSILPFSNDSSVLRISCNLLNQLPTIICLKLGITNINILNLAFGAPLFFNAIIGFSLCWNKCRKIENGTKLLLFPIAAYAFFCIPSDIFAINQAFTAYWIYFILYFHIIADNKKLIDKLFLYVLLVIASCSHESFLVVGPLLFAIVFLEYRRSCSKNKKTELCVSGMGLFIGIGINIFYIHTHTAVTGSSYFSGLLAFFQDGNLFKSNILISVLGLALVILGMSKKMNHAWIWFGTFVVGIIYIIAVHYYQDIYSPFAEYMCRSLITIGIFGGILLAYAYYRLCDLSVVKKICIGNWWSVTVVVFMLQCIWQFGNTYAWNQYINELTTEIQTHRGIYETKTQDNAFSWVWIQPSISLLLSDNYNIKCLIDAQEISYRSYVEDNALWIPFMWVDPSVYEISELIKYEEQPVTTIEDCKDIVLQCNIENISDSSGTITFPTYIQNNSEHILRSGDLFASYHIYDSNGLAIWDGIRTEIEQDILPGECFNIDIIVEYGEQLSPGDYLIELDLVKENQYWFNDQGMTSSQIDFCYMPGEAQK